MTSKIQETLVKNAYNDVGIKEIKGNKGWYNKVFEAAMLKVGWRKLLAWCAFYHKKLLLQSFAQVYPDSFRLQKKIKKLCTGSALRTFQNFSKDTEFKTGKEPQLGAAAVWNYSPDGKKLGLHGHIDACVVEVLDQTHFKSVGGNVSDSVSVKNRDTLNHGNTLFLGFIYPPESIADRIYVNGVLFEVDELDYKNTR